MNKKIWKRLAWIAAGALAGIGAAKLAKEKEAQKTRSDAPRHSGTVLMETDRLVLREFTPDDAGAMYKNWANDPEVTRYLTWQPHQSVEESQEILEQWIANYEKGDWYNWAIELKELGEPIGNISVVQQDARSRRAQIGYCLGKTWWHQGIMSEALSAVMEFLFSEGYLRIEAAHDVNNPHSGDVMKKCGMEYEGTMPGHGWNNSGICDEAFYGVLSKNYYKKKHGEESE